MTQMNSDEDQRWSKTVRHNRNSLILFIRIHLCHLRMNFLLFFNPYNSTRTGKLPLHFVFSLNIAYIMETDFSPQIATDTRVVRSGGVY